MIIALDCESTGLDLVHGARPFLVTMASPDWDHCKFCEWDVDPLTRQPQVDEEDVWSILEILDEAEMVYTHNGKFDVRMLAAIGIEVPWRKFRDSIVAGHMLASNHKRNLTDMVDEYLGIDIEPYELSVKEVVRACRVIAKKEYPDWWLAEEGAPGMPSVKDGGDRTEDKPWKNDMWLPRALHRKRMEEGKYADLAWLTVCSKYANADSEHTLDLALELERRLREQGLWNIYMHRLELVRADAEMETYGVTARGDHTEATISEYEERVAEAEVEMVAIAAEYDHDLELAAGASLNDNMRDFFYGAQWVECPRCSYRKRFKHWNGEKLPSWLTMAHTAGQYRQAGDPIGPAICPKCAARKRRPARVLLTEHHRDNLALPPVAGKTGNASLDAERLQYYLATTDGDAYDFIKLLADKRAYDTAIQYMEQYRRFWVPEPGAPGYFRVHCWLNPCGTDHLRQSSNGPNMQNTSSKEITGTRACFGPAPGREFWSLDYESIEARIPAYESGEEKLVEVFERPNQPPYWGNLYYLTASLLYPDEFGGCCHERDLFKERFGPGCSRNLYKRAKFFVLAKNYGAGRRKGDLLSGVEDSYDLVDGELPKLAALQRHYLRQAEREGYVETLPDVVIEPARGYPILPSRTDDGRVLSTTPFNYHVSGTACQIKNVALVRCAEQCRAWRADGFDGWACLEVHDEILFDFPRGRHKWENAWRALVLRNIMEDGGPRLRPAIPTPVSVKLHQVSWNRGESIPKEVLDEARSRASEGGPARGPRGAAVGV